MSRLRSISVSCTYGINICCSCLCQVLSSNQVTTNCSRREVWLLLAAFCMPPLGCARVLSILASDVCAAAVPYHLAAAQAWGPGTGALLLGAPSAFLAAFTMSFLVNLSCFFAIQYTSSLTFKV